MLNDGTMRDEIKYKGYLLIIDTCDLGEHRNLRFETMAMRQDGRELDCIRTSTLEEAQRVHNIMLEKYKGQEYKPLTGKYLKLKEDLIEAYAATQGLEATEDGGTCNFDSPVLELERWNANKVKQAAEEAGGSAFKWDWGRFVMGWVINPCSSGQANRRTRRAEAISEYLKTKGYETSMYYQMD